MPEDRALSGGCHCGAIRYRAGSPVAPPTLCHCASCRRAVGSHIVGLVSVAASSFALTCGDLKEYLSSPRVFRGFCEHCGTSLTYRHLQWPEQISLTLASLDAPEALAPASHTGLTDALPWDTPEDGLIKSPGV